MSAVRRAAAIATDLTCQAVGRRAVVRTARFVLSRARLDYPNVLSANGESALQRWILRFSQAGEQIHVADVGANVGRWSESMLAAASEAGREMDLRLHAFEPDSLAFARLTTALGGTKASLSRTALSDRQGTSPFHVVGPAAGTNSLYPVPGTSQMATEQVATITLDSYAEQSGVARFALVKIDAEGHDLAVLRGARALLAEHRIAVAQFEYNHRWILARFFLRDAFEFLLALGYRVGKLTPRGVEFYPGWDADLETFVEGNYLACDPKAAAELPAVTWWKSE
jgi:FkbM family methyltransferase